MKCTPKGRNKKTIIIITYPTEFRFRMATKRSLFYERKKPSTLYSLIQFRVCY